MFREIANIFGSPFFFKYILKASFHKFLKKADFFLFNIFLLLGLNFYPIPYGTWFIILSKVHHFLF